MDDLHFPSIKFGLMVGIGGGIAPKVRLGDVVVSAPTGRYPWVVQWDYGKAEKGGEFKQTGSLNNPPALLRTALAKLTTANELSGSKIPEYLDELRQRWPRLVSKYTWSESLKDPLHTSAAEGDEGKPRETRVHYGLIASGNQVIKDAEFRDRLDQRYEGNVLCVEMEAAGLMNNFPCIVIRGICDYADSQKNKDWQQYAAAVAAAFAKELLHHIQPRDVDGERPVRGIIKEVHNDVTHIKAKLDGKDDIEILDWLTRTDYGPQQSDYFNRLVQGMFLLAQLHFETIKTKKTLKKLKDILTNIPTGQKAYDFAYEEAVRRIQDLDSDSKELAWLVLSWITCAKRPLTTEELQHALAVEIGKTELDEENLVEIEDMVSVCAGLVTIDEESKIIRLVHYTTQEYFERTQNRWFPTAQTGVTTVCVTYLSFSAFETGPSKTNQEFKKRLQLFPFYGYAARNWGHHAPKDEAIQEVIEFLESRAKVEASSQALMFTERFGIDIPERMTGLHLAGFFGLYEATYTLLELRRSPNRSDGYTRFPLWYAAQNGHDALVGLLSARRGIVNTSDTKGQSALSAAAENGHQEVVEKLLEIGADMELHSLQQPQAAIKKLLRSY
ncbi:hypothetical protein TsFJ059_006295 [Trichoderma semiorbis]|uniref:Nucleoside phosphorylase domain-containing protein n=1 Tax=Trichoderma semiorbis TaxID=1491008 RepID=A0A9P8KLT2_9HYPO|nr:hypothetical protein TsFJ059_006295 [Trichoderma semiorbis]